jgi:hypothetical protein
VTDFFDDAGQVFGGDEKLCRVIADAMFLFVFFL